MGRRGRSGVVTSMVRADGWESVGERGATVPQREGSTPSGRAPPRRSSDASVRPAPTTVVARRKAPHRYASVFSPEALLPREVHYIPYTHAVAQARKRRQRAPLVGVALSIVWAAATSFELVGGDARVPVVLGIVVVSFIGFGAWNVTRLVAIRRGEPSGAVWRYGIFLWPDALVVLPADGPVVIVARSAIEAVEQRRDETVEPVGAPTGERVVSIRAVDEDGSLVNVIVDDLGAMPAPHLVRTIEGWRTGLAPSAVTRDSSVTADRSPRRG
jgi:hypothetical protein